MIRHAFWAVALLTLIACSKNPSKDGPGPGTPPPPPTGKPFTTAQGATFGQKASAVIGAAGGQLQSTDGKVRITVPAGAVAGDQTFSIQAVSNTLRPDKPLFAYRLLPENVNFTKPVTVKITYDPVKLTTGSEDMLMLAYQDNNGTWKPLPTSLNKTEHSVTAAMSHFCDIAFYELYELFVAKKEIKAGQEVALRCGVQEISPNHDSLLAPLEHKVDDAAFGRTTVSNYSMIHNKYAAHATGWKIVSGPGTVTAAKNPFGLDGNAIFKAPATVAAPANTVVEVTLDGLMGMKDPSAPNGTRKPEKLVLRQSVTVVPDGDFTFMKIEIDGEEFMFAPEIPMYASYEDDNTRIDDYAHFEAGIQNGAGCQLILYNPKIGEWPCGPQESAATEARVLFEWEPTRFARTDYCETVGGTRVEKYSTGKLTITKVGNANQPIEGHFIGKVYRSTSVVNCQHQAYDIKVTFRFLRFI